MSLPNGQTSGNWLKNKQVHCRGSNQSRFFHEYAHALSAAHERSRRSALVLEASHAIAVRSSGKIITSTTTRPKRTDEIRRTDRPRRSTAMHAPSQCKGRSHE